MQQDDRVLMFFSTILPIIFMAKKEEKKIKLTPVITRKYLITCNMV